MENTKKPKAPIFVEIIDGLKVIARSEFLAIELGDASEGTILKVVKNAVNLLRYGCNTIQLVINTSGHLKEEWIKHLLCSLELPGEKFQFEKKFPVINITRIYKAPEN